MTSYVASFMCALLTLCYILALSAPLQGADYKAVYRARVPSLWGSARGRDGPRQRIQRSGEHPPQVTRAGEDAALLMMSTAFADYHCLATTPRVV